MAQKKKKNDFPSNIECFDHCVAIIFAKLYESFPVPIDLKYGDIECELLEVTKVPAPVDGDFNSWWILAAKDIPENTIKWLRKAE